MRTCKECGREAFNEYQMNCAYCGITLPKSDLGIEVAEGIASLPSVNTPYDMKAFFRDEGPHLTLISIGVGVFGANIGNLLAHFASGAILNYDQFREENSLVFYCFSIPLIISVGTLIGFLRDLLRQRKRISLLRSLIFTFLISIPICFFASVTWMIMRKYNAAL